MTEREFRRPIDDVYGDIAIAVVFFVGLYFVWPYVFGAQSSLIGLILVWAVVWIPVNLGTRATLVDGVLTVHRGFFHKQKLPVEKITHVEGRHGYFNLLGRRSTKYVIVAGEEADAVTVNLRRVHFRDAALRALFNELEQQNKQIVFNSDAGEVKKGEEEAAFGRWMGSIVPVVLVILVVGGVLFALQWYQSAPRTLSPQERAQMIQHLVRDSRAQIPVEVAPGVRGDDVSYEDGVLEYTYTLTTSERKDVDFEGYVKEIGPNVVNTLCQEAGFHALLMNDIVVSYTYLDMSGEYIGSFEINDGDCDTSEIQS